MTGSKDKSLTVDDLQREVSEFIHLRQWEPYHNPKAVALSIAIEAAELMEPFQWLNVAESWELLKDDHQRDHVAEELADVLIYCLSFARLADIDIVSAIQSKLAKNRERFPIQSGGNPPG